MLRFKIRVETTEEKVFKIFSQDYLDNEVYFLFLSIELFSNKNEVELCIGLLT